MQVGMENRSFLPRGGVTKVGDGEEVSLAVTCTLWLFVPPSRSDTLWLILWTMMLLLGVLLLLRTQRKVC